MFTRSDGDLADVEELGDLQRVVLAVRVRKRVEEDREVLHQDDVEQVGVLFCGCTEQLHDRLVCRVVEDLTFFFFLISFVCFFDDKEENKDGWSSTLDP